MFGVLALSLDLRNPALLEQRVMLSFGPVFGLWLATIYAVGLYDLRLVRDFVALVGALLASAVVCWILAIMFFYLFMPYLPVGLTPKTHLLIVVVAVHTAILAWRRAVLAMFGFSLLDLRILVLADNAHRDYLHGSIRSRHSESLNFADQLSPDVDLVVVDTDWISYDPTEVRRVEVRRSLVAAVANRVPVVSVDEFYESLFGKVAPINANDLHWAIDYVLSRHGSLYFKCKRVLDVIAAVALIIVTAPVMATALLVAVVVDRMSPIYGQMRIGYLGRPFVLWKLQTMCPGADSRGPFALGAGDQDPQVTRIGRILRRFRLDELPQLYNVLRGDMSLVGPRPEWIKEVEILEKTVPNYHLRHLVPPGITGWAQVYFRATNDPKDSVEKHHYDLYYLKHFSFALDLSIMLKTINRVFVKDSRVPVDRTPYPFPFSSDSTLEADIASIVGRDWPTVVQADDGGRFLS